MTKRLIDAENLKERLDGAFLTSEKNTKLEVFDLIDEAPAVEVSDWIPIGPLPTDGQKIFVTT